jgi:hypothetical protein
MKNGVWVGGLILTLGGLAAPLFGQDAAWRSANSPQPVPASALNGLRPCPSATLGKPVCVPAGSAANVPAPLRPIGYLEPAALPGDPANPAGWTEAGERGGEKESEFAIDRPIPLSAASRIGAGDVAPAGLSVPGSDAPPVLPAGVSGAAEVGPSSLQMQSEDVRFPKFYLSGEYLLWWFKQDKVPVLASTSSNPFDNGELGKPTTQVLFGGDGLDGSARSGFRVSGGYWLDQTCKEEGIDVSGFYFTPHTTNFNANSSQFPVVARPFFNVNQGIEFSQLTAFPGIATGNLSIHNQSNLFGAEINARCNICCGCNYRLDVLGGFRYLNLEESLSITETGLFLPGNGPPLAGDTFLVHDFFGTRNQFFGGQVGVIGEYDWGRFSVTGWGKVALGDTHQNILIDGNQVITAPNGTTQQFTGGLLALTSNIGHFRQDRFSVIPELNLNVGYQVTDHVRLFVGYDVLYWNNVVRPGGQIDRNLDITLIPNFPVPGVGPAGQNQPSAPRPATDFWAQGVTFGVEFRY